MATAQCTELCDKDSKCKSFRYGVAKRMNFYDPRDCETTGMVTATQPGDGCDVKNGQDLYIKRGMLTTTTHSSTTSTTTTTTTATASVTRATTTVTTITTTAATAISTATTSATTAITPTFAGDTQVANAPATATAQPPIHQNRSSAVQQKIEEGRRPPGGRMSAGTIAAVSVGLLAILSILLLMLFRRSRSGDRRLHNRTAAAHYKITNSLPSLLGLVLMVNGPRLAASTVVGARMAMVAT